MSEDCSEDEGVLSSYRPITDMWLLARPKVKYYGAYPAGFLGRARDLLGVGADDPVLHVCSGRVQDYPYRGYGRRDATVDIDPGVNPTYVADVRDVTFWQQFNNNSFGACLIDRPYTEEDAAHYAKGADVLPNLNLLLRDSLMVAPRVGVLDYIIPRPPKNTRFVACVGVIVGFGNRGRFFTVFENEEKK